MWEWESNIMNAPLNIQGMITFYTAEEDMQSLSFRNFFIFKDSLLITAEFN